MKGKGWRAAFSKERKCFVPATLQGCLPEEKGERKTQKREREWSVFVCAFIHQTLSQEQLHHQPGQGHHQTERNPGVHLGGHCCCMNHVRHGIHHVLDHG